MHVLQVLMKYFKYTFYLLKHKWYVMLDCFKAGLFRAGIFHDWSKLRPSELVPYANFFYGLEGIKKGGIKKDRTKGYYKPTDTGDSKFDMAWFYHQRRNKHHWQYWTLVEDQTGVVKPVPMPMKYVREMVSDWQGAGQAQNSTTSCLEWFELHKDKMQLHHMTEFNIYKTIHAHNRYQNRRYRQ